MSKKLANLVFEQASKKASLPAVIHPIFAGKHLAPEHLIYATDAEANMLRARTDGKSDTTQFGPESFTDPSQSQGNSLSSTPTRSTSQSRAGQSNQASQSSVGVHTSAQGTNGGGSAATRGAAPSSSGSVGSSHSTGMSGLSGVASIARNVGTGVGGMTPASSRATDGTSFSAIAGGNRVSSPSFSDHAWSSIMGDNPVAAATNRMTVAQVPSIPAVSAPPGYLNSTSATPDPAAALAAQYANYQHPPGYASSGPKADVTNRDRQESGFGDTVSPDKAWSDNGSLVGTSLAFSDPRAGYYDKNGVTQQTQFADRLREQQQLNGMVPNDNANAALMGSLQNENLPAYMTQGSNPWNIDSPAAFGNFKNIGTNKDFSDSGLTLTAGGVPQWNGPRLAQANSFFSQNGLNPNDPNSQAAAIASEMAGHLPGQTGDYADTYNKAAGQNLADATRTMMRGYENPSYKDSVNNIAGRTVSANQFAQNIPNQAPTSLMAGIPSASVMPASYGPSPAVKLAGFNRDPATLTQGIPQPMTITASQPQPDGPIQTAVQGGYGMVGYGLSPSDPTSINKVAMGDVNAPNLAGFATPATANTAEIDPSSIPTTVQPITPGQASPPTVGARIAAMLHPSYDPRTAGTMNASLQTLGSQHTTQAQAETLAKVEEVAKTNPAAVPMVQGPTGPAYSVATANGVLVIDQNTGKSFKAVNGRFIEVDPNTGQPIQTAGALAA